MAACFVAAGTAGLSCSLQNEGGPVTLLAEKMSFASLSQTSHSSAVGCCYLWAVQSTDFLKQLLHKKTSKCMLGVYFQGHFYFSVPGMYKITQIVDSPLFTFDSRSWLSGIMCTVQNF